MPKGISSKYFIALILFAPAVLEAQVITEVFYSPQSRSWIEIYNNTSSNLDLTKYKVLDAGAATNGHGVSFISGSTMVAPGGFAVIAKDPTQFAGFSVPLFKSALAAKTSGDTISIKDAAGNISDSISFSSSLGANGDGNSLQKFDTGWMPASTTPGAINVPPVISIVDSEATSTATTTDTSQPAVPQIPSSHYSFAPISESPAQKLSASAGRNRLGYVGIPLAFKAELNTYDPNASIFWSFGDGSKAEGKDAEHVYLYPGSYVLVLNVKLFGYEAVSRVNVKIVEPEISIYSASQDSIGIKNSSQYELNLYGYRLRIGTKIFEFPIDTILSANTSLMFPNTITKLEPLDAGSVKLENKSAPIITSPEPVIGSQAEEPRPLPESRAQEIQALGDKLVALRKELYEINNPKDESAQMSSLKTEDRNTPQTAAAAQAIASTSWITTLKHFFFR